MATKTFSPAARNFVSGALGIPDGHLKQAQAGLWRLLGQGALKGGRGVRNGLFSASRFLSGSVDDLAKIRRGGELAPKPSFWSRAASTAGRALAGAAYPITSLLPTSLLRKGISRVGLSGTAFGKGVGLVTQGIDRLDRASLKALRTPAGVTGLLGGSGAISSAFLPGKQSLEDQGRAEAIRAAANMARQYQNTGLFQRFGMAMQPQRLQEMIMADPKNAELIQRRPELFR